MLEKKKDIKLATTEKRHNYLVSKPSYHKQKIFNQKCISHQNKKHKYS